MLIKLKHQGSTAEKSSAQKFNQGVWTNVLKATEEVREDIKNKLQC